MYECALNTNPNADGSCFTPDQVILITKYTNGNSLAEVKQETTCNDDVCILTKVDIPLQLKSKLERETFKAATSSFDHNYWLNNTEIDTVMSQMRVKYLGYAHGFIHMSDLVAFDPANICSFDYPVLNAKKTDFANEFKCALIKRGLISGDTNGYQSQLSTYKDTPLHSYGIVCNTDTSKGSGQHWFTIFISSDLKDPSDTSKPWIRIECFNSAGGGSGSAKFDKFWQEQASNIANATGLKCTFDTITNIQHQSSDTGNCGSYSLYYIQSRLHKKHPSDFDNPHKPITDHEMRAFREVCFRIADDTFSIK